MNFGRLAPNKNQVCLLKPYPSDVSDQELGLCSPPYLTLMTEDAPQRDYPLRELFNALRWLVRAGAPWRHLPGDSPPSGRTVYQQTQRWIRRVSLFTSFMTCGNC